MSIDAHVSKKLRDKILCDDFIDLGSLLPNNIENETWAVTICRQLQFVMAVCVLSYVHGKTHRSENS
jgi:hypothetical protein